MDLQGKVIGIIGAMAEEVELLLQHMSEKTTTVKAGISFTAGRLHGKSAVVCKSGVGKVNAAVCTQLLIDHFAAGAILFTGVAGALDPALGIGDVVVSRDCLHHDMDVSALGFPRGVIPYAETSVFESDPELAALALECGKEQVDGGVYQGRILSGDQFVADRQLVRRLHTELGGMCTEMEGAAVAQVCVMNGIPHVVIRSMSDKADGSAPDNFAQFTVKASENSFRIVEQMLKRL
jgi:adenosylhomocysteine nucleosidase